MRIRNFIRDKLFSYYLKKGIRKAVTEIKNKQVDNEAEISKAITNINNTIFILKEEVDIFVKVLDVIEEKYGSHQEAAELSTVFPFLNLSMLDILILARQYLSTKDILEKNFICRTAAQHMYEFLEDGSKALGKQMTYTIDRLNNLKIDLHLKELRKQFYTIKNDLHSPLKKLRHNVSGHKDRDVRYQLEISKSIDTVKFQDNFFVFMQFFVILTEFKTLVINEIKRQESSSA